MSQNHGVAYVKPGEVEVQEIEYPKLALGDRKCKHGVILKIVSTNICGSDQHMVRGRTTAPAGLYWAMKSLVLLLKRAVMLSLSK
jgi:glutathione-independent formaldehyde dehydrogenase